MKKYVNGKYVELTQEEIEEIEKMKQESQSQVQEEITIEDRISSIEDVILSLL